MPTMTAQELAERLGGSLDHCLPERPISEVKPLEEAGAGSVSFLANPKSIQQGYSVAEPIYIENQGKFKPVVHLLADHGFSTYSTVIEARTETVKAKPEMVQREENIESTIVVFGSARILAGEALPDPRFDITTTLCKIRDLFSRH